MATWRPENSMLTQRGVEILNKLKAGVGSITVTRIVAGSGRVAESLLFQQTSISGVQKPMTISGKNTTDVGSEITFYIENKDFAEPYDLHQIGIYVTHPDYVGEQLYHISQCDANDYDTIPAISYTPVTQGYSVFMEHGNSSSVNITVDPSGMINTVQFNEFKESTADMFQHINTDIVNLQNGKAPAGYGLGLSGPPATDDCDTATKNGWYHVYGATLNKPFGKVGALLVACRASTQIYQLFFVGETYSTGGSCIIVRSMYGGEWGPWEWVNPPFDKNVVYPTTERHLGNPVYKKMDSNGVIWWSTDQSTWKCESERVGAYSKSEADTLLKKKANQNLLDNWYFGNPVNQRGKTTYTVHSSGDQYTIDRWLFGANNTITLQDGYISVGIPYSMVQYFEMDLWKSFAGRNLTFSLLYKDGTLLEHTFKANSDYTNVWTRADFDNNRGTLLFDWFNGRPRLVFYNSQYGDIVAVKIEFGDQQTLAHLENGKWVLNEIPNYAQELAKCQRYFVNFNLGKAKWFSMPVALATANSFAQSPIILPVSMRTTPTLSYGGNLVIAGVTGSTGVSDDIPITSMRINDNTFGGTSIQLQYYASGLTNGAAYRVQGGEDPDSYICLSADL